MPRCIRKTRHRSKFRAAGHVALCSVRPLAYGFLFCAIASVADAQQAADPQRTAAALARAQGLLRQIGQQKAQLETDNANLAAEIAGVKRRLASAESKLENTELDLASSTRQNERTEAALARLKERLEKTTERLREFVEKFKATSKTLAETEFEKSELEAQLEFTRAELADSEKKNIALYESNLELLDLYTNKSPMEGILQREPFTGIKNVEIENIREEYKYKMYDEVRDVNLETARTMNEQ